MDNNIEFKELTDIEKQEILFNIKKINPLKYLWKEELDDSFDKLFENIDLVNKTIIKILEWNVVNMDEIEDTSLEIYNLTHINQDFIYYFLLEYFIKNNIFLDFKEYCSE